MRPNLSLVLGDVGRDIGEVTSVTIPFERLDLFVSPRHGTSKIHTQQSLVTKNFYESAQTAKAR
jgi:hypothetical protein